MKRFSTRELTLCAVVAAIYTVLGYFGNLFSLTFGAVQCRFGEALTVLPYLCPVTAWGLAAGCFITNLLSPYGPLDLIAGTLATLLAGFLTARCRVKWLAPVPPVVCNAFIVGAVIAFQETGFSAALPAAFFYHAVTIGAGQCIACVALGLPLMRALEGRLPGGRR